MPVSCPTVPRSHGIPVPAYSAVTAAPTAKAGRFHGLPEQNAGGSKRGRISNIERRMSNIEVRPMPDFSTGGRARLSSSAGPAKPYRKMGPIVQKRGGTSTGYWLPDTDHRRRSRQIGLVSKYGPSGSHRLSATFKRAYGTWGTDARTSPAGNSDGPIRDRG